MRILDLSAVTSGIGFPVKEGTWDFLQGAYKELVANLVRTEIGLSYDRRFTYILYGCELSIAGPTVTITPGALFANDEIYIIQNVVTIPAPTGSDVVLANLHITPYTINADPVLFTDGTPRYIHNIRNVLFLTGPSGSGTLTNPWPAYSDFSTFVRLNDIASFNTASLAGKTIYFTNNQNIFYVTPLTGTTGFTLDFTNARVGVEIFLQTAISSSPTITVSDGGAVSSDFGAGYGSLSGKTSIIYKFKYLGSYSSTPYYSVESWAN